MSDIIILRCVSPTCHFTCTLLFCVVFQTCKSTAIKNSVVPFGDFFVNNISQQLTITNNARAKIISLAQHFVADSDAHTKNVKIRRKQLILEITF